ncbi:hypothetical protein, partial [Bacteroides caecimuris]
QRYAGLRCVSRRKIEWLLKLGLLPSHYHKNGYTNNSHILNYLQSMSFFYENPTLIAVRVFLKSINNSMLNAI